MLDRQYTCSHFVRFPQHEVVQKEEEGIASVASTHSSEMITQLTAHHAADQEASQRDTYIDEAYMFDKAKCADIDEYRVSSLIS